jgi:hypothetical protein
VPARGGQFSWPSRSIRLPGCQCPAGLSLLWRRQGYHAPASKKSKLLKAAKKALASLTAANTFTGAQYGTGGTGLRNRGSAGIQVSGVVGPAQAAFLYWAVITTGSPPSVLAKMSIRKIEPPSGGGTVRLAGTLVGTGPSPCWGGLQINVYKAALPLTVANGNGFYHITLPFSGLGSTGGEDPWASPTVFPLWEGASLVIVGTGGAIVNIFDTGLSGNTFFGGTFSYDLPLPAAAPNGLTLWDTIGADGQVGASRTANSATATEDTFINTIPVSGPGIGAPDPDSDWNGNSAAPLPQLWDDTGHEITTSTTVDPLNLHVEINAGNVA